MHGTTQTFWTGILFNCYWLRVPERLHQHLRDKPSEITVKDQGSGRCDECVRNVWQMVHRGRCVIDSSTLHEGQASQQKLPREPAVKGGWLTNQIKVAGFWDGQDLVDTTVGVDVGGHRSRQRQAEDTEALPSRKLNNVIIQAEKVINQSKTQEFLGPVHTRY